MRAILKVLDGMVRYYSPEEMMELLENPMFPRERRGGMGSVATHESAPIELWERWAIGSTTTERMADPVEGTFSVEIVGASGALLQYFINERKQLALRVVRVLEGEQYRFTIHEANVVTLAAIS